VVVKTVETLAVKMPVAVKAVATLVVALAVSPT
jgi:hypothetical protein